MDPWICATPDGAEVEVTDPVTGNQAIATSKTSGLEEAPDQDCEAPAIRSYYYQPADADPDCDFTITGGNACFEPFDPDNPPADEDIATFTNDRGDTVRSILLEELGTLNRGMYRLFVFHDPAEPHHPADPQRGWNNKLLMWFGFAAGNSRFQEAAPGANQFWNEDALKRGYMLGASSLANNQFNTNHSLAAETLMMFREHVTNTFGEIRFALGSGASGSAIQQISISASYPGLLDGLLPAASFPDTATTSIEVIACGLFVDEYLEIDGMPLDTEEKQIAVTGHDGIAQCQFWVDLFLNTGDPSVPNNCGGGFPADLTYDPVDNPGGIRCNFPQHMQNMLGTVVNDTTGFSFAPAPLDNHGVQFGLQGLQNGDLSVEEFVHLNENIGLYDNDLEWSQGPERTETQGNLANAYRSGMVAHGANLARVPIVELRHDAAGFDFHANWRAMQLRQRLLDANGHHDNHVILGFEDGLQDIGLVAPELALNIIDAWLEAIEADDSDIPLEQKVINNRPDSVDDTCFVDGEDVGLDSAECPINFEQSPAQVAGGPRAENVFKCQLKPLDFDDPDYTDHGIGFNQDQQDRLEAAFPDGVCDSSLPGVGQQPSLTWPDFSNGPGGEPAGPAPGSI